MRKDRAFRNETVWLTLNRMAKDVAPILAELARESGYSEPSCLRALDDLIEDGKAWHYDWRKVHGRYLRSYKPGEMPKGFKLQITPPRGRTPAQAKLDWKRKKSAERKAAREAARIEREKAKAAAKPKRKLKTPAELKERELATERATYARNRLTVRQKRKAYYDANRDELNRRRRLREAEKREAKAKADNAMFAQLIKDK